MGSWPSKLSNFVSKLGNTQARITMLGLNGAGKTTVLYRLKWNETLNDTMPTFGFNAETLPPIKNLTLTIWEVDTGDRFHCYWGQYCKGASGLIFVIDSSEVERIAEAREELFGILDAEEFMGLPVLVLANKQDLTAAMNASQMVEKLGLTTHKRNPWHVQETCARTGDGLYEGLEKLVDMVKKARMEFMIR